MSEKDFYNQLIKMENYLEEKIKKEKDPSKKAVYQMRKDCLFSTYLASKDYYANSRG